MTNRRCCSLALELQHPIVISLNTSGVESRDISGSPGVRCNRGWASVLQRKGTRRNRYSVGVGAAGQPSSTTSSRRHPTVAKAVALYRPKTLQPPSNNRWLFSHIRPCSSLRSPPDPARGYATPPASETKKLSRIFHVSHSAELSSGPCSKFIAR